jgi:hypothetical protein
MCSLSPLAIIPLPSKPAASIARETTLTEAAFTSGVDSRISVKSYVLIVVGSVFLLLFFEQQSVLFVSSLPADTGKNGRKQCQRRETEAVVVATKAVTTKDAIFEAVPARGACGDAA